MGMAEFIKKEFMGQEICVTLGFDAETITYDQCWSSNREYFRGIVRRVEHGILELEVPGQGSMFINCSNIVSMWQRPFDYYKAIRTTITRKPARGRRE